LEEKVSRKYTPISHITQLNTFDLLIKIYYKSQQHPEGGKLTQWLDQVPIGTEVNMRGPRGRFYYYGNGDFHLASKKVKPITWRKKQYKKVAMICGGTGITPIYQILQAADLNKDSIEYTLLYGNRSSKDILLKKELDGISKDKNINLKLFYTIDKDEEGWDGLVGYITKDKIEKYISPPSDDTLILTCGSGKMCKKYLVPLLIEMGYKEENIHNF
jgi:NAD(P)H-flavin reductase